MTAEGDDDGGDPACWAHLFDDIDDGGAAEEPPGSYADTRDGPTRDRFHH